MYDAQPSPPSVADLRMRGLEPAEIGTMRPAAASAAPCAIVLAAPPEESSICHCRMCQKASGQPFMAFARVKAGDLAWTRGAPAVFQSSNLVERGFCRDCGTPLTYRFLEDDAHQRCGRQPR